MTCIWLSCVINLILGNMGSTGREFGRALDTKYSVQDQALCLEATFIPSLFSMKLSYIPLFAGPKRAVQQNYVGSQSTVVIFIVWCLLA